MNSWYLVIQLASSLIAPTPHDAPLIGPITEIQCQQTRDSLAALPSVVSAKCRKAVGMTTRADGALVYAYPLFEGDLTVSVGTPK